MLNHKGVGQTDTFWCLPGGEIHFGETIPQALVREFREETGLEVTVGKMLFVNESLVLPLHAIEFFFEVTATGGQLKMGTDPEMSSTEQIIQELKPMGFDEIKQKPAHEVHVLFSYCNLQSDIYSLTGYLTRH